MYKTSQHIFKFLFPLVALSATSIVSLSSANTKPHGVIIEWDQSLQKFENTIGAQVAYQGTFVHWGNENQFPTALASQLAAAHKTLVIFWETMDYNRPIQAQPEFAYDAILSGTWDAYVREFALQAKAFGGPVIVIPFSEMNGDWTPTGRGLFANTPTKHVKAFQRVHAIFREPAVAATNVKFGWAVNATPAHVIPSYFPGDAYVDYVGVDGFNWDKPWKTFGQVFGPALRSLSQISSKPIFIFSFASEEGPAKPAWIADSIQHINANDRIAGWLWFNIKKERNWLVDSTPSSLQAFRSAVQAP